MKGSTKFWLCLLVLLLAWWAYVHITSFGLVMGSAAFVYIFLSMLTGDEPEESPFGKHNFFAMVKRFNTLLDKIFTI